MEKIRKYLYISIRFLLYYVVYYIIYILTLFGILIKRDKLQLFIIRIDSFIVRNWIKKENINKILLLLPHCLQWSDCPYKITFNIKNCRKCGRCQIKNLIELAEKYNVDIFVATGGTLARMAVKKSNPDAILAIACERDLFEGLKDTFMMPVLGIENIRPNGPCYNTMVNLNVVEKYLKLLS